MILTSLRDPGQQGRGRRDCKRAALQAFTDFPSLHRDTLTDSSIASTGICEVGRLARKFLLTLCRDGHTIPDAFMKRTPLPLVHPW
jgi:hypothetical protein